MCDYSLGGLPNRLAEDGEELIVHRFSTHSIGLASPADLQCETPRRECEQTLWRRIKNALSEMFDSPQEAPAVCIPPGASLVLKSIPLDLQLQWSIDEQEPVLFVQTSAEVNTYRDALQFSHGRQVLLQDLREGMRVKVISMGAESVGQEDPALAVHRH
jgi:hypothetical protein